MAKVTMPQLGESVAEGTIGKWLKKPGDSVAKYEPLLEVITDKVNAEVPSPFEGILREILVEEGATVPNNAEIAVIETADEAAAAAPTPAAAAPTAAAAAAGPAGYDERGPSEMPERAAASAVGAAPTVTGPATAGVGETDGEGRMTPAVRRLLREHMLLAGQIVGTGGGGRITREDVTNYVESQRTGQPVNGQVASTNGAAAAAAPLPAAPAAAASASAAPAAAASASAAPAAAASASAAPAAVAPLPAAAVTPSAAPATAATPAAASAHAAAATPGAVSPGSTSAPAADSRSAAPARGISGQQVTFPDGIDEVLLPMTQMRKGIANQMTKALQVPHAYVQVEVDATKLVKLRDAQKRAFQAQEGISLSFVPFVVKAVVHALKRNPAFNAHWTEQGLLARRRINIGVAVAVPDGLIVPVVHDVDQLSIAGINRAIADVAARARANKLRLDDIQGSTFTIDNTGWFGSNMTMPIINVPEVAILTMENIIKRAVVVETDDGDVIAIRPIMNMVIGIDHRANDGAQAAAFINDVKAWLESLDAGLPLW